MTRIRPTDDPRPDPAPGPTVSEPRTPGDEAPPEAYRRGWTDGYYKGYKHGYEAAKKEDPHSMLRAEAVQLIDVELDEIDRATSTLSDAYFADASTAARMVEAINRIDHAKDAIRARLRASDTEGTT